MFGKLRLLNNLYQDTIKIAKHWRTQGLLTRPAQERLRVLNICKNCPTNRLTAIGTCGHDGCGCNIANKVTEVSEMMSKVTYAGAECPDGHWGKYFPPDEEDATLDN